MNLMWVGCFYGITDVFIVQTELPIFLYSLQTMSSCDILAYIMLGGGTQPALFVPFFAFRHNGNVNMLNIRGLSYRLASLFVVIMSLGEGSQCLQTREGAR